MNQEQNKTKKGGDNMDQDYVLRILKRAALTTSRDIKDIIALYNKADNATRKRLLEKYKHPRINYRFTYKQQQHLRQMAAAITVHKNNIMYNNKKIPYQNKVWTNTEKEIKILYKKTDKEIENLITRFLIYKEEQQEKVQLQKEAEQRQQRYNNIIVEVLKNPSEELLHKITSQLRRLQEQYCLDLDINFDDKLSIIENYQQILAYKKAGIKLQPREELILVGNPTLLEDMANQN